MPITHFWRKSWRNQVQISTPNNKVPTEAQANTSTHHQQIGTSALWFPPQGGTRLIKVLLDYAIALPSLIVMTPLFLLLALLIKLDSPGPIFHRREMMGQNGRIFPALKFRTMTINGHDSLAQHPHLQAELAQNFKLKSDPRVTRLGRLLRNYSLDALPQFFNVLAGDMSLIGPRFVTPEEIARYGANGAWLLTVPPGLTGLWQVSGRSDTSYEERIRLDMIYSQTWSLWLDLKILLRTPWVVVQGKGAY